MGTLEFAGKKFEITPEDYYTMMVAAADREAYCRDQIPSAGGGDYEYWQRELSRATRLHLKLVRRK